MKTIVNKTVSKPGKSPAVSKAKTKLVNADLKSNKTDKIAETINTKWILKKIVNHYLGRFHMQLNK